MEEEVSYNSNNNDESMIVVKMDEQRPIHDTSCQHETLVPDPEDTIGEAIYHGCSNPYCGAGFYLRQK